MGSLLLGEDRQSRPRRETAGHKCGRTSPRSRTVERRVTGSAHRATAFALRTICYMVTGVQAATLAIARLLEAWREQFSAREYAVLLDLLARRLERERDERARKRFARRDLVELALGALGAVHRDLVVHGQV